MCRVTRKAFLGDPTRSDTNRAVQPQKMARGMEYLIKEVEGLYNLCSQNKSADQLHSYRTADLCLCFRICKNQVFYDTAQIIKHPITVLLFNKAGFENKSIDDLTTCGHFI